MAENKPEENDNVRQLAQFTVFFGNYKKAQSMKPANPEAVKNAKAILDKHCLKMDESIEKTKKEIAGKGVRSFTTQEVSTAYKETRKDVEHEIAKLKKK
jgi:hypothetical protein